MRDAPARHELLPAVPQPGPGEVVFRLQENMLFQVVARRQAMLADIVLRGDGKEMELPKPSKPDVRGFGRAVAEHHVGLVFPQAQNVDRTLQVQPNFGILRGKLLERWRSKKRIQPIGDADAHGAFRLAGLRLQVAGDRMECVIQSAQGLRERLALLGQLDPTGGRYEKLRADHVLQPLDLSAYRRLAGVGDLGGAVERLRLGHGEKDAQVAPELAAQELLVVERAPVEGLLFLVECIHGFCSQVEVDTTYSLTVFRGRSPRPGGPCGCRCCGPARPLVDVQQAAEASGTRKAGIPPRIRRTTGVTWPAPPPRCRRSEPSLPLSWWISPVAGPSRCPPQRRRNPPG